MSAMSATATPERREVVHGNAYNIFILVLTIGSLVVMTLQFMPFVDEETKGLLSIYDNLVCIPFLIDFAINLRGTRPRRDYLIKKRGWLDLIGSIPTFGFSQYASLLRLARLSRLARVTRLLRGNNKKMLIEDVVKNRGSYALFITLLLAMIVLVSASVLILQFETQAKNGNIKTGGDALWWGLVTITTVGYGDFYPVTPLGRLTGTFVMFAGVGIIGALASILASILIPPPKQKTEEEVAADAAAEAAKVTAQAARDASTGTIVEELAMIRAELAAMRAAVGGAEPGSPGS